MPHKKYESAFNEKVFDDLLSAEDELKPESLMRPPQSTFSNKIDFSPIMESLERIDTSLSKLLPQDKNDAPAPPEKNDASSPLPDPSPAPEPKKSRLFDEFDILGGK